MTYELAKELKDAGFPSLVNIEDEYLHPDYLNQPDLSELIEACREQKSGFRLSCASNGIWNAELIDRLNVGIGSTPEEAVAHLWLALKKK